MSTLIGRDPTISTKPSYNFIEKFFLSSIQDSRDLVFVKKSIMMICFLVPSSIYFYFQGDFNWYLGIPYVAFVLFGLIPPYVLMLHNVCHRSLFKTRYKIFNHIIPTLMAPFLGQSPQTYHAHHISMHHPENNMHEDKSSTLKFQRDSFFDFMRYLTRFIFLGLFDATSYLYKKKRFKAFRKMLWVEFLFVSYESALFFWKPDATLAVFIIPYFFSRFAMMMGNWIQHAFVDSDDPNNCYKNSITCIDTVYNRRCFNDGYHIGHHVKASRHWTEMPQDFLDNKNLYIKNQSMVFRKLDYFMIWVLLMAKRHKLLAGYYVDLTGKMSSEEIVSLIRRRLKPVLKVSSHESQLVLAA